MKNKLLITLLTISSYSFGQIKITKVETTKLPKGINYSGLITNSAKWTDSYGVHYVMTTETGVYFSKDDENNVVKNSELFAYHYVYKNDSIELICKIYDFSKNCDFDVYTKFIDKAFTITDLDKNGVAEIWVMYENQCTSDVSPAPTKIIMYEGNKKYAIRGESRVKVSLKNFIGGDFTLDENFKKGDTLFKQFGIRLWEKNMLKRQ